MLSDEETRRRIRAARELATPTREEIARRKKEGRKQPHELERGLSQAELAARLTANGEKLGQDTLGLIERGKRRAGPRDLGAIMDACGLPGEFASVDLWLLEPLATGLERFSDDSAADDVTVRRAFTALAEQQRVERRLADLEAVMREVVKRLPAESGRRLRFPPSRRRAA